ncbi:DUF2318 domain-containing protein [Desulfuromonas sp. TF]|uniref:DUF2318 domain-containing protein n=1 Tax=Desulfuromonas sp. TF TaxID=1232410 RepID=UPI000420D64F|nr:DUF2318 domain-containing protein [Desulfuromonas sp. TF]
MSERQEKRSQFQQEKKRHPLLWVAIVLVAAVAAAGMVGWKSAGGTGGAYQTLVAEGGKVTVPVAQVSDGKAHYFSYRSGDDYVNFFLLQSHDGVIRAAFDACDVCYHARKGYRQEGDSMVCNNCNMKFRSDMINEVKGGCNPAPIERSIADGRVVIAASDLELGGKYFPQQ